MHGVIPRYELIMTLDTSKNELVSKDGLFFEFVFISY
jgi:hypothetical protein